MDVRVIERPAVDLPAWDALVQYRSFFQTVAWADVCAAGMGRQARAVFLCAFEDGVLKAGLPAITTRRFGLKSFFSMPYGTYGGAVYDPGVDDEFKRRFCGSLTTTLDTGRFWYIDITDYFDSLRLWSDCPLIRTRYETHIIELQDGVEFMPSDKGTAGDIRAGEKRGGRIVTIDSGRLNDFFRLYRLTEKRHGRTRLRYSREFFKAILDHLGRIDRLYWTGFEAEGTLIGSQINFVYGDTLFYWQAVSDYDKRWYKPNQALLYDAILHAGEKGLRQVNLGGSPQDAVGLRKFKEQWGGQPMAYDMYSYRSRLHRLIRR
ncbi:MAG: GNAT family N-acetyltransferase [candidate division Zixibacteria bacterium]|nr:GNAT family N-acetyltransferase [candidate division Zixibacteria bacterium]